MDKLDRYIYNLTETNEYGDEPGWYYEDEEGYLTGPFETEENAKHAFVRYLEHTQ